MKILSFINLPWDHMMSHKKFGPDRFSRFDVYWIQTDRQTDKQTDKPNLYIDLKKIMFSISLEKILFLWVLIFHDVILHHPNCWMICTGTCTAVLVHAGLVDPACCMHNIWTGCIDYMMCFYFQIYSQREDWYWLGTRRFRFCYFYLGKGITQIFHWCENVEGFHIYTGLPNPQRMRLYFDDFKVK